MNDFKKQYSEKLKDPRWQKLRLEVFERDNWTCQGCGDKESTLNIHHRYYEKNKEPWEYPIEALVTLCEFCHQSEGEERRDYEDGLLRALRRKFFSDAILDLGSAIYSMPLLDSPNIVANAYILAFQDKTIQKMLIKKYLKKVTK